MDNFNQILSQYLSNKQMQNQANLPGSQAVQQPSPTAMPSLPIPSQNSTFPSAMVPISPFNQPEAQTLYNDEYLNSVLQKFIGQKVQVEFLIGTNTLLDRTGYLLEVGSNYILLNELEQDDILVCDFYSIKFVRVFL